MWIVLSIFLVLILELARRNRMLLAALKAQAPKDAQRVSNATLVRQLGHLHWLREQQNQRTGAPGASNEQSWLAFFAQHASIQHSPQALALYAGEQLLVCEGARWGVALEGRVRGFLRRRRAGESEPIYLSSDALLDDLAPYGIARWLLFREGDTQLWAGFASSNNFPRKDQLLRLKEEYDRRLQQQRTHEALTQQAASSSQRAAHQERVLAQVSHDIRSPLLSVSAALYALRDAVHRPEDGQLLQSSLKSCEQVSELLDDLLDVVRDASSALSARPTAIAVAPFLEELSQTLLPLARAKGLALRTERDSQAETNLIAHVDPRHLRRMLSNVVSNAIKYTRQGTIVLRAYAQDARVVLDVRDSGIGMSQEQIQRLCEPFQRFAPEEASGVGLGMAVTRALIKANQAELEVRSEIGKGSTFRILLQPGQALPVPSVAQAEKAAPAKAASSGSVILLDDNAALLASLQRLLQAKGYQVRTVQTLDALAHCLSTKAPDILIGDAELECSGLQDTARTLAQHKYQGRWLVLSGDARQEPIALQLGAQAFFLKPVDPGRLLGAL